MSHSRKKTFWLQDSSAATLPGELHNNAASTEEDEIETTYSAHAASLYTNPVYIRSRDTALSLHDCGPALANASEAAVHTVSAPILRKAQKQRAHGAWRWQYLPLLLSLIAVILAGAALAMVSSSPSSDATPDTVASTGALESRVAALEVR